MPVETTGNKITKQTVSGKLVSIEAKPTTELNKPAYKLHFVKYCWTGTASFLVFVTLKT